MAGVRNRRITLFSPAFGLLAHDALRPKKRVPSVLYCVPA